MVFENVIYVEVDGEAYWDIVDKIPYYTDTVSLYNVAGDEVGVMVVSDIDEVAKLLHENGYIECSEWKLVAEEYSYVLIANGDKIFG